MTIGSLKQQLEERWAIPVAFQSLTFEAQVLNNDEQLGNCSAPNATNIFMHMVVSLDRAPEELRNPDPQMCLKALTFITHAAQTIDAKITTAVTARALENSDQDGRLEDAPPLEPPKVVAPWYCRPAWYSGLIPQD